MKTPALHTRREFLRTSLLGGALTWTVPSFIHFTMRSLWADTLGARTQRVTGKDGPILVVLQLAGGNDGLNTLVPFGNDSYYRARPRLAIAEKDVLRINDQVGMHPGLAGLKSLYDEGVLAVVQGVGYPNPNRSHFRSMEIWQTASDAERFESRGWIGRYFDCCCSGSDASVGISVTQDMPQAFAASLPKGITFKNLRQYQLQGPARWQEELLSEDDRMQQQQNGETDRSGSSIGMLVGSQRGQPAQSPLDFLERTHLDAQVSSEQINRVVTRERSAVSYPANPLAQDLSLVAKLIAGGLPTRIYYLSQGGYDTHTNQAGTQQNLLTVFSQSVRAFVDDLKAQGNLDRVVILTFSEFGRRVAENANGGTDHGTAAPLFLAGGGIKAGLFGAPPSLSPKDLDQGDLKHTVDFRSVYATVLEKHLRVPSPPVLGRSFPLLNVL